MRRKVSPYLRAVQPFDFMSVNREIFYIGLIGTLGFMCIVFGVRSSKKPEMIENKIALEINGKLVLTMTNNCVFIEQTK